MVVHPRHLAFGTLLPPQSHIGLASFSWPEFCSLFFFIYINIIVYRFPFATGTWLFPKASQDLSSGSTTPAAVVKLPLRLRRSHRSHTWWSWSGVVSLGEEDEAPVHHPSLSKKTTHPSAPLPLPSSAAAVPLLAQVWIWSLADYLVRCHTSVCFRCAWHCWLALMPIRLADLIELVW